MKKIIFLLLSIILIAISCDKIESPYYVIDEAFYEDNFPSLNKNEVYRKVLMEEFTGHTCNNCPLGHRKIEEFQTLYGDTIVVVSYHAGILSRPESQSSIFSYDFRTEEGNAIFTDFNVGSTPGAIFNRIKYNDKWSNTVPKWKDAYSTVNNLHPVAAIQLNAEITPDFSKLKVNSKTTMLDFYNSAVQLSLFIAEDNIVKPQKDGAVVDTFYHHNHVFRRSLNGTYGVTVAQGGILQKNSSYLLGYTINIAGTDWNKSNLNVIAVLHDPESKEVLQTEILHVGR